MKKEEKDVKGKLKHYVVFLYPGTIFTERVIEEVKSRDPAKIHAPKGCFGFHFCDRMEAVVGGERLLGEARNFSGTFYFGQLRTIDEIEKEMPDPRLLRNMKRNNWKKVVLTRCGNYQPFEKRDVVIG